MSFYVNLYHEIFRVLSLTLFKFVLCQGSLILYNVTVQVSGLLSNFTGLFISCIKSCQALCIA